MTFRVGGLQGLCDLPLDKNPIHFSAEVKSKPADEDAQGQFVIDLFGLSGAALNGAPQIAHGAAFEMCHACADHGCHVRVAGSDMCQ